jgi:polyhydroxyalkanoate synthase subunit PhaC
VQHTKNTSVSLKFFYSKHMTSTKYSPAGHTPAPLDIPLKVGLARLAHGVSTGSVVIAYADWLSHLLASPSKQVDLIANAWRNLLILIQYTQQAVQGRCANCVEPLPQDKRFSPQEWKTMPFSAFAQAFLLHDKWWTQAMTGVRGVSKHHQDVVAFSTRQWLDMWSPSNFLATNPQVLRQTFETGGANLVNGFTNWSQDALTVLTQGKPRGVSAFVPGQGVALTPGKVVFRNALIELIQYDPITPEVGKEPLLIIPSWIMKYYILDLTPADSLVGYLVKQGHTVYMVSWKNPSGSDRNLGMDDYLETGLMAAVSAVQSFQPRQRIHAVGYCLGGTLLSIAAAAFAARGHSPFKTVTLMAAQTDFHEPGELGLFIDESQIAFLEDLMAESGYLDGRQMAGAFALINSKDLVWSKLVHEYLMGAQTPLTALRAWNADATRLPARMHSEYLRRLYLHNDLAESRYLVRGQAVHLADIETAMFVVATEHDHVSPWQSVYKIHQLVRGPVSFVLSSGGHNVAIVNPPEGPAAFPQASYRTTTHAIGKAPDNHNNWLVSTISKAGSWWPCWHRWLVKHSSGRAKPPNTPAVLLDGKPSMAPGSYVFED